MNTYTERHPATTETKERMIAWLHKKSLVYMEEFGLATPNADEQREAEIMVTQEWLNHLDAHVRYAQTHMRNMFLTCAQAVQTFCTKQNPHHTPSREQVFMITETIPSYFTRGMQPSDAHRLQDMFEQSKIRARLDAGDNEESRIPDYMDLYERLHRREAEER